MVKKYASYIPLKLQKHSETPTDNPTGPCYCPRRLKVLVPDPVWSSDSSHSPVYSETSEITILLGDLCGPLGRISKSPRVPTCCYLT